MSIILGYDPKTLRELVDQSAIDARLEELGDQRSSVALNEKVGLLRLSGRLEEAWAIANQAVMEARFGGDRERLVFARIRRSQVQQFQGKLEPALAELSDCVAESQAHDWAAAEAFALQNRGRVEFELGDVDAALRDFRAALTIRVRIKSSPAEVDSSMIAIALAEALRDSEAG